MCLLYAINAHSAYNLAEIMELNQCPSKGWVGSDCRLALDRNEVNIYQTN